MIDATELARYCDALLRNAEFEDYCPNGLQVAGARPLKRIVTGVTACQALIDAAVAREADALLVHHGLFWKGDDPRPIGPLGRRIATLIRADVALLAYHLPLDAHPELGNNRQLAVALDIHEPEPTGAGKGLVWRGTLAPPLPAAALAERIARALGRAPLHISTHTRPLGTLAWCTGAAADYLAQAAALGVDAYLSGEIAERTVHQAREWGVDYFAVGHHASERAGIRALGEHLAQRFGLFHCFVDVPNPV